VPDDTSGNYTKPDGTTAIDGQVAMASQHNLFVNDAAAALSRRLFADGRKPWVGNQNANGFKVTGAARGTDPNDYVTLAQLTEAVAGVSGVPTGTVIVMTGTQIPSGGYAILNGQARSRSTDAALWAYAQASGNLAATEGAKTAGQFGPGDGSTTFTLPNLYADGGYFIRPISSGRGIGTVQTDMVGPHPHTAIFQGIPVPGHTHPVPSRGGAGSGLTGIDTAARGSDLIFDTGPAGGHTPAGTVTINTNSGTETRPKNIAYPVLIKT